jgi:hypothetical protein
MAVNFAKLPDLLPQWGERLSERISNNCSDFAGDLIHRGS